MQLFIPKVREFIFMGDGKSRAKKYQTAVMLFDISRLFSCIALFARLFF